MPQPIHNKYDTKTLNEGANYMVEPEYVASLSKGEYIDAQNNRPNDMTNQMADGSKIKGEQILYPSIDNSCSGNYQSVISQMVASGLIPSGLTFTDGDWQNMAVTKVKVNWTTLANPLNPTSTVNNQQYMLVELWADRNAVLPPFIRVGGTIVCANITLPISVQYPITSIRPNDNCIGGEIYFVNYHDPLMIMQVYDMCYNGGLLPDDNGNYTCTNKYFTGFQVNQYSGVLTNPNNSFAFKEITTLGGFSSSGYPNPFILGGNGMKVGTYTYMYQYVDAAGNVTPWSIMTPGIPLPYNTDGTSNAGNNSALYPWIKTFGASAAMGETDLGIVIQLRIYNVLNYVSINIARADYNAGIPIGGSVTPTILNIGTASALAPGEISVRTFFDMSASGTPITTQQQANTLSTIGTCKSLRYFNNRLWQMNVKYADRSIVPSSIFGNTTPLFPVMEWMGIAGHKDPYHHTYHKNYMSGERFDFAMVCFDSTFTNSFAIPIPTGTLGYYQVPNRREPRTGNSDIYSYNCGYNPYSSSPQVTAIAGDINGNAIRTFERFVTDRCIAKTDSSSSYNICNNGQKPYNLLHPHNRASAVGYKPLTPKGDSDTDVSGHAFRINDQVYNASSGWLGYEPEGFAPEYMSCGWACPIDVSKLPSWVTSFVIVRSDPAGRVMMQGLGFYDMNPTSKPYVGTFNKDSYKTWFFSPDLVNYDSGYSLISNSQISAVNSGQYTAQAIAPYGMFSEVFLGDYHDPSADEDWVDMCCYCRIIKDYGNIYWSGKPPRINPDPRLNTPDSCVMFGTWQNGQPNNWTYNGGIYGNINTSSNPGEFSISGFSLHTGYPYYNPGRVAGYKYYDLTLTSPIYNTAGGSSSSPIFRPNGTNNSSAGLEPMYLFNIVNDDVLIPQTNTTNYYDTGTFAKIISCLGQSDGSTTNYPLVDERWEDCCNGITDGNGNLVAGNLMNSNYSYLYIQDTNGSQTTWMDSTYLSNTQISNINALINTTGYYVGTTLISGLYRFTTDTNNTSPTFNRFFTIIFDVNNTTWTGTNWTGATNWMPTAGYTIWCRYDSRMPLRIFGGDSFITETIFPVVDTYFDTNSLNNLFNFGTSFPYFSWNLNDNYLIPNHAQAASDSNPNCLQQHNDVDLNYIRQMVCVFNCETRMPTDLYWEFPNKACNYNSDKYFPATNYVMRPLDWGSSYGDNFTGASNCKSSNGYGGNIIPQYDNDYPNEWREWGWGGFHFRPSVNIDYIHDNDTPYTSQPIVGYVNKTLYCTRVAWSLDRPLNTQDVPNLKTFLAANVYDASDDTGCIDYAFDALTGNKGSNLFAVTDHGVVLFPTMKSVVSENATSNDLEVIDSTVSGQLISSEYWIDKENGMDAEMWRSAAEAENILVWTNLTSVYMLEGEKVTDLGKKKYHYPIKQCLDNIDGSYNYYVTAGLDKYHGEYWVQFEYEGNHKTFAYNFATEHWNGHYTYRYDKYVGFDNRMFGIGNRYTSVASLAESYELNLGNIIGGNPITHYVVIPFAPVATSVDARGQEHTSLENRPKEFKRIRIASSDEPTEVDFFETVDQVESYIANPVVTNTSLQSQLVAGQFHNYYGYEQYIPRRLSTAISNDSTIPDTERHRLQGRLMVALIGYNGTNENYKVVNVGVQTKDLK